MAAELKFLREGEIRMQVAQRTERGNQYAFAAHPSKSFRSKQGGLVSVILQFDFSGTKIIFSMVWHQWICL
jgi:hypothetical protein